MDAVTLRRLLVLGVCAVGISCLYLAPGMARSPQLGPRPHDEPKVRPSNRTVQDVPKPTPVQRTGSRTTTATEPAAPTQPGVDDAAVETGTTRAGSTPTGPTSTGTTQAETTRAEASGEPDPAATSERSAEPREPRRTRSPAPRPSGLGATAFDPAHRPDDQPPSPVAGLVSPTASASQLTLSWPAASDNVGVVAYEVVLNGFQVATTPDTHASVRWFNDDAKEHIIQVLAVDAAGNRSPSSPRLLVARPTPEPTPTPSPATPAPTPEPTPSASVSVAASAAAPTGDR